MEALANNFQVLFQGLALGSIYALVALGLTTTGADPGEPCIALIVVEKPIVLTGPFGRFLNPLVRRGVI